MSQNWRTEVDAADYFGHQKKQAALENRRPVIRRAADLVGPGIDSAAIRVTDFDNILATFNGYYSGLPSALHAPTSTETLGFVGFTVMDALLGGRQVLTGLATGFEYTRVFRRNPSDATSISWGSWETPEVIPASAAPNVITATSVPIGSGSYTNLIAPTIVTLGKAGSYVGGPTSIAVSRPGVYTGYMTVVGAYGLYATLVAAWPQGSAKHDILFNTAYLGARFIIPFTFWTDGIGVYQEISLKAVHGESTDKNITWSDFVITRIGPAS